MVNEKFIKEIKEYIYLNDINISLESYINKLIEIGFNIEKYGFKPNYKETSKPVIVEKVVEKEIYINDDSNIKEEYEILKNEHKELKIKLLKFDKENKIIENKYNNIIEIIESHTNENDFYGEEDGIIKRIKNEIKRK